MKIRILVCTHRRLTDQAPSCGEKGAEKLLEALRQRIKEEGLPLEVKPIECLGRCQHGPNLRLAPNGRFYTNVTSSQLAHILTEAMHFPLPDSNTD